MISRRTLTKHFGERFAAASGPRVADELGQTTFFILIFMPALLVLALLAMSIAMMLGARASAQRAADAAALAACYDLPITTNVQADASTYGASSGNLNAGAAANLDSGNGGQTALATATSVAFNNDTVTVNVSRTQPLIGTSAYGFANQTITASAKCQRAQGGVPVLLALDTAPLRGQGNWSFRLNGGTNLSLGNSGMVVDSTDPNAFQCQGNTTVVGSFLDTGSGQFKSASCTGVAAVSQGSTPDPFSGVAEPSVPSSNGSCTTAGGTTTCTPGLYTADPNLSGTVTLTCTTPSTGCIFYFAGSGLTINQGATLTGSGAVIFNGDPTNRLGQDKCGDVNVGNPNSNNRTYLNLSPPSSGPNQNLTFFQSRSCTNTLSIIGPTTVGLAPTSDMPPKPCGGSACGAFYLQQGLFSMSPQGTGNTPCTDPGADLINAIFIANKIDLHGPICFNNPYIPSGTVQHGIYGLIQ